MEFFTRYGIVRAHGTTELDVVYTNDSNDVPSFLSDLERWHEEEKDEKFKFMGLDFEYTADGRDIAVIQICFQKNVMVFQWASSNKKCEKLLKFLVSGIRFVSVAVVNDRKNMKRTWGIEIDPDFHIDLQDWIQLDYEKTGMADMAAGLIDEEYADMKKKFPKNQHKLWEKTPLDEVNIVYAAKDAYVAYELYRRLKIFKHAQRHLVRVAPPPVADDSSSYGSSSDDEY